MCNELISDEYKTFLSELNFAELVQTAFQTIYEHLQREADCRGCLESCTILLCLLLRLGNRLKLGRLKFIYMVLQTNTFHNTVIATRMVLLDFSLFTSRHASTVYLILRVKDVSLWWK